MAPAAPETGFILRGRCPQCSGASELSGGNPARPFCSERCKLLDLDGWLSGRFAIAVDESLDAELDDALLDATNTKKPG